MSFAQHLIEQTQCSITQALLAYWGKDHPSLLVVSSIDPKEIIDNASASLPNSPVAYQHKHVDESDWQPSPANQEMLDLLKQISTIQIRELYLQPENSFDSQKVSNMLALFLGSLLVKTNMTPKEAHALLTTFCLSHGLPMPNHCA